MAQTWRVTRRHANRDRPPLTGAALEALALAYVGRYATTVAKLRDYLTRKVRERGWGEEEPPRIEAVAERLATLGYIDDAAFAAARAGALARRGYGERRIGQALRAAGVKEAADETDREQRGWEAAIAFARRKRLGPFAVLRADRDGERRAIAAMLRAGHDFTTARRLVSAAPGSVPHRDG